MGFLGGGGWVVIDGDYNYPKNSQVFKKSTMNIHFNNNKRSITTTKKFLGKSRDTWPI